MPPSEQPHPGQPPTSPDQATRPGSTQERAAYLAYVAHEMRNPLSTALWSAELLGRMSAEDRAGPRGEKLAGMCLRTLARLRHLVEDHFLTERLAIDGLPIRQEPLQLPELLRIAAKRAQAKLEEPAPDVVLSADRAMAERAIEAMVAACARDGATVRADAEAKDGWVTLRLTGAPPDPDALRTPDRSTPSDPTGRVLGLRAARAVVEAHGGTLAITPDGYVVRLPGVDAAGQGDAQ